MSWLIDWLVAEFSNPLNAVAQIVGIIPLTLAFFTFLSNDRRRVIGIKITTDLLWTLHYFLLGEVVGGAVNGINTVRNMVFSQKGHRRWASRTYILVIFCILIALTSLLRWQEWYSFLPMLGSILAAVGFWCSDAQNIRKFNLPAISLWLVYSLITGSISGTLCNVLSIASILSAWNKKDEKEKREEVVEE